MASDSAQAWAASLQQRGYERVPDRSDPVLGLIASDTLLISDLEDPDFRELVSHYLDQRWKNSRTGT